MVLVSHATETGNPGHHPAHACRTRFDPACRPVMVTRDGVLFDDRTLSTRTRRPMHPDIVIGQGRVEIGDGHLGHVAGQAALGRVDLACGSAAGRGGEVEPVRLGEWHDRHFVS